MPDPWGPPSIVSLDVHEAPIREVLSRLDGLTGQLSEYAAAAIRDGATSTEDARTLRAIEILAGAALEALFAWDRWLTVQRAPETEDLPQLAEAGLIEGPEPTPDGVVDLMAALEEAVAAAKAALTSNVPERGTVLRHRTPDQLALAEAHRRLQQGDG
jgi:hypothetical protein